MKYPVFHKMGDAVLYDGSRVVIMSPLQWNRYCYDYNYLNGIQQPPQLLTEINRLNCEE